MGGADQPKETNEILLLIWQEMKALNGRTDQTNARLEQGFRELRDEFDDKLDALRRQMVESDMRVATAVTDLAGDVRSLTRLLREGRPQLAAHEERIVKLEQRMDDLQSRLPR